MRTSVRRISTHAPLHMMCMFLECGGGTCGKSASRGTWCNELRELAPQHALNLSSKSWGEIPETLTHGWMGPWKMRTRRSWESARLTKGLDLVHAVAVAGSQSNNVCTPRRLRTPNLAKCNCATRTTEAGFGRSRASSNEKGQTIMHALQSSPA